MGIQDGIPCAMCGKAITGLLWWPSDIYEGDGAKVAQLLRLVAISNPSTWITIAVFDLRDCVFRIFPASNVASQVMVLLPRRKSFHIVDQRLTDFGL